MGVAISDLAIETLHPKFGARVTNVDLSTEQSPARLADILAALDEYSLLCFPEQAMSDDAHLRLTRQLGEPEPNHLTFGITGEVDYFGTLGNVIDAKRKKGNADPHTRHQSGNNLWHSDSSFRRLPAKFSINHAYEVPGEGGETEFASQRSAYECLSADVQDTIADLLVLHDYVFSRSQIAEVDPRHAASLPPVRHRLVRINPSNGRKNYYAGSHARSIDGWAGIDSRDLIDMLTARATVPENIYKHRWQVGDTMIWDNRCLLHRGTGYDADRWRRLMRQTRVAGEDVALDG